MKVQPSIMHFISMAANHDCTSFRHSLPFTQTIVIGSDVLSGGVRYAKRHEDDG